MGASINSLLVLSAVGLFVAAVVGGGVKAGPLEIPHFSDPPLRVAVAGLGMLLFAWAIVPSYWTHHTDQQDQRAAYVASLHDSCAQRHDARSALIDKGWKASHDPAEFGQYLSQLAVIENQWIQMIEKVQVPKGDRARLNHLYDILDDRVERLQLAARATRDEHSIEAANVLFTKAWRLGMQFDRGAHSYGFGDFCLVTSTWVEPVPKPTP